MRARDFIPLSFSLLAAASAFAACSGGGGSGGGGFFSVAPSTSATTAVAVVPVGSSAIATSTPLLAGAVRVDITPPIGVPLAGYGGGQRRHKMPNLNPFSFDHFLMPSTGIRDPINARALFVSDGKKKVVIVTLDAIATTHEAVEAAWRKAQALGSSVPMENLMMCASHSHSGPGTLSRLWFWQLTAADLFDQTVFDGFTDGIAQAIVQAERSATPAKIGAASSNLTNASHNRRAGVSKVFQSDSIDPEMLVLRVDSAATGQPIATLWNFAIHGISLSDDSHVFSGDIMGGTNLELESRGAGVALFVNSAEGDITPTDHGDTGIKTGGKKIADCILATRQSAATISSGEVDSSSEFVDFGPATLDVTQQRLGPQGATMLQTNGWLVALQKLGVGPALGVKLNFPPGWIETQFRFQAIRIGKWGFASIPGEAIHTIGWDLKARGKAAGFDHTFTCGLANGHMAYITTKEEFWYGGYEALATFWGDTQADKLEDSSERQMRKVKP